MIRWKFKDELRRPSDYYLIFLRFLSRKLIRPERYLISTFRRRYSFINLINPLQLLRIKTDMQENQYHNYRVMIRPFDFHVGPLCIILKFSSWG